MTTHFTDRDLTFLLSQAFKEADQALHGEAPSELALEVLGILHNATRVLIQRATGENLRLPSGRTFSSIDEFWRLDLRPALDAKLGTKEWARRRVPDAYDVNTTVSTPPS